LAGTGLVSNPSSEKIFRALCEIDMPVMAPTRPVMAVKGFQTFDFLHIIPQGLLLSTIMFKIWLLSFKTLPTKL